MLVLVLFPFHEDAPFFVRRHDSAVILPQYRPLPPLFPSLSLAHHTPVAGQTHFTQGPPFVSITTRPPARFEAFHLMLVVSLLLNSSSSIFLGGLLDMTFAHCP